MGERHIRHSGDKEVWDIFYCLRTLFFIYLKWRGICVVYYFLLLHFLLLFWVYTDGSTCIHPQRTPKKQKFWKFFAIQGIGCIDRGEAAARGSGDTERVPHVCPTPLAGTVATLWQLVTYVLSPSLHWSLPPWPHRFSLDAVSDGWEGDHKSIAWYKSHLYF